MRNLLYCLLLSVFLASPSLSQTIHVQSHNGSTVELGPNGIWAQGQNGSTWLGLDSQGQRVIQADGPRGRVILSSPSDSNLGNSLPVGSLNSGVQTQGNFHLGTDAQPRSQGLEGSQPSPQHWTLGEANDGSLILSEPNVGSVVIGRGPQATSTFSSPKGSFTINNDLLLRVLEMEGDERSSRLLRELLR